MWNKDALKCPEEMAKVVNVLPVEGESLVEILPVESETQKDNKEKLPFRSRLGIFHGTFICVCHPA